MISVDQTSDYPIPAIKVYKTIVIRVGAFLGGPLVAGYFIAENFKAFNEDVKAIRTWVITIIVTIVLLIAIFFVPLGEKFPVFLFPLIYSWIAYYIAQNIQGASISNHISSGGQTYSWWRVIGISLIGAIVTVVALFIVLTVLGYIE